VVNEKPNNDQLMALFNGVTKMTVSYNNGSTLILEGEALANFITFQKSMVFLYNTFAGTVAKNQEEAKAASQQPLTRTTLGDQLNRNANKKGQS
jgi:hypothetical protein